MKSEKVLIITYYWAPAGGPGVQRWLKFAKYLPEFNFEPIIYTPENPSYPIVDESLEAEIPKDLEVIKTKIWEPYKIAEKLNPKNKQYKAGQFESKKNQSFLSKLSVYIRGNFFIPDARICWVKPSVKFLDKYLKENQIQKIITSGPPHSLHLIGLKLKNKNPQLKWIADFRDPWTQISYHSQLKLTKKSQKKHLFLESSVMQNADCVLATSFSDALNFKELGAKKIETITNGYEEKQFEIERKASCKFNLVYSGGLEIARNPAVLWQALKELIFENPDFAKDFILEFYGKISDEVKESIKEESLQEFVVEHGYVSHTEAVRGIVNATMLFLTNFDDEKSKGIIPGKIFEYLATKNPTLAIGPKDGDLKRILEETASGEYFTFNQKNEIKSFILQIYSDWKNDDFRNKSNSNIEQFSRKNLTHTLSKLLSKI